MEHVGKRLSCAEANKMDMVYYLATIGIEPVKTRGQEFWYISPFREDNTPSFKVDRRINKWYDHGEGKGGNLVDFGLLYYRCNVTELLNKLSGNQSSATPIKQPLKITSDDGNRITVIDVKLITNPALLQYAQSRAIPIEIVQKYCSEVSYTNAGKNYYAIGFKNDLGGYELRSKYFKGSSAPKGVTHLKNGHQDIAVFEGFFNFLSFQTQEKNRVLAATDFLILNSLSFFEKARPIMESYKQANLYLDNNNAGKKFSTYADSLNTIYKNCSNLYQGHGDLNDSLRNQPKETDLTQKRKKGLRL